MDQTRKMAFAVAVLVLGLALGLRAEVVKDIRIVNQSGTSFVGTSVTAYTSFRVGDQAGTRDEILAAIAVDVNRLRESGRFSYVDARMSVDPDGVILTYTVLTKHKLRRIEVVGADKMSNRKVRKKLELEIGQQADDAAFAQAASKLKEAYRDFWFPDTEVRWESTVDENLGTIDAKFIIDENDKLKIRKIVFEGNEHVKAKDLRKVMKQKKKWILSFITGAGKYLEDTVDADMFAIKSLYMDAGYLDVQVFDTDLQDITRSGAVLLYRINEGQKYKASSIKVTGVELFPVEEIQGGIVLAPGDTAAWKAIEAATETIRAYYGNRGYIRTSVRPVLDADAITSTVDIRFEVAEGSIAYINQINIRGNEKTKDKVIRRELVIHPGEKYHRGRVSTSENRLRNLNFFETVATGTEPVGKDNLHDLTVQVKEKPTGQFSAGVGFSSVDALVGYVEIAQGNFDITRWPPVGAGQKFKIRAQLGTQRNDLDISFVEPWFLDRQLSLGVDLFHHESRYFSDDYDQVNDGARVFLSKPLSRFMRGRLSYTLEQFEVFDVATSASDAIKREEGERTKSSLELSISRDTRDQFFTPTRGNQTSLSAYLAGGPLWGETDIYGARLKSTQFWNPVWDHVFNIRGRLETVNNYGDSDFVPIFDRLFLGGSYTLRGFEFRDVGPKDATGEPIGGQTSGYVTFEYTVPVWTKIRAAAFYDAGFVNSDFMDFDPSGTTSGDPGYNTDWGIGIRLDLPGFPLHLDYAWPIRADEENDTGGRFNFIIGHVF
ncbi:MAG: outer membrane protein assembly factor BamA [Kiritimatiellales bacterium]|nr:outer membrane protein assembly factor BamA [Kiritimatiellales bacterium]